MLSEMMNFNKAINIKIVKKPLEQEDLAFLVIVCHSNKGWVACGSMFVFGQAAIAPLIVDPVPETQPVRNIVQ